MTFKKIVLKNTTTMSLNERFTWLRNNQENAIRNIRGNNALLHQASVRNQRLALQMERRPAVMAALKLKKRSLRQRLGQPATSSVKDRLTLNVPARGGRGRSRGRGRGRGRGTGGGSSGGGGSASSGRGGRGRLSRSQSMQSLGRSSVSSGDGLRFRRGQGRGGSFRGGSPRRGFKRGGRMNRGGGGAGGSSSVRGMRGSRGSGSSGGANRFNNQRNMRGRGSFRRNRGRGRGARGRQNANVPSKEELDLQLDQYMAGTKSHLDKELDSYMNQATEENWDMK